jgi:hypothetical protein
LSQLSRFGFIVSEKVIFAQSHMHFFDQTSWDQSEKLFGNIGN